MKANYKLEIIVRCLLLEGTAVIYKYNYWECFVNEKKDMLRLYLWYIYSIHLEVGKKNEKNQ